MANATTATKTLSASLENYLETIFLLTRERMVARSKDISERMKVNRSSVTGALQALRERGLVNYERYGFATLTQAGEEAASRVLRRHEALRDFFVNVLSVDETEADEAACRMEHGISKHIVDRLVDFAEFVETCPRAAARWDEITGYHCTSVPSSPEDCELCVEACLDQVRESVKRGTASVVLTSLGKLKPGQKAQITNLDGQSTAVERIRDTGATTGSVVEVVRVPTSGTPIDVKIRGYHLSLSRDEAAGVSVRKVEQSLSCGGDDA
jgi:DtxR family transcriptional regulator, Mn-dependent transcriptional regulator